MPMEAHSTQRGQPPRIHGSALRAQANFILKMTIFNYIPEFITDFFCTSTRQGTRTIILSLGLWTFSNSNVRFISCFIHSFIEEFITHPFKKPTRRRPTVKQISLNLQNASFSPFLGRRRTSKGSPFQVEGPTMENARRCLAEVVVKQNNHKTLIYNRNLKTWLT